MPREFASFTTIYDGATDLVCTAVARSQCWGRAAAQTKLEFMSLLVMYARARSFPLCYCAAFPKWDLPWVWGGGRDTSRAFGIPRSIKQLRIPLRCPTDSGREHITGQLSCWAGSRRQGVCLGQVCPECLCVRACMCVYVPVDVGSFWVQNPSCLGWPQVRCLNYCSIDSPHPLSVRPLGCHQMTVNFVSPCLFPIARLSTYPCLSSTQHNVLNLGGAPLTFPDGRKEESKGGRGVETEVSTGGQFSQTTGEPSNSLIIQLWSLHI